MLAIGAVVVVVIVAAGVIFIIVVGAVVDTNDHFLLPPCPFSVLHPSRFHLPRTLDGTFELAAQGRQERPRTWQDTEMSALLSLMLLHSGRQSGTDVTT